MKPSTLLLGAHTSTEGGLHNAIYEGQSIEATTVQLFTSSQRQWHARTITDEDVALFQEALKETQLSHIMSHASYLINLGSPKEEVYLKSQTALRHEIERSLKLGISYVVFHPGAALDDTREAALDRVVDALKSMHDLFKKSSELKILIETTAGQGSTIGSTFEEIAYMVERTKNEIPIGVCIDTCHIFVAGYDIRDKAAWKETLKKFDSTVGLSYLQAFHINDSMKELGSHVDRHEQLGDGMIGLDSFRALMQEKELAYLPKYLETPGGCEFWKKEIALLKSFVR